VAASASGATRAALAKTATAIPMTTSNLIRRIAPQKYQSCCNFCKRPSRPTEEKPRLFEAARADRYGHLMPGNEEQEAGLLDAYLERANTQARMANVKAPA